MHTDNLLRLKPLIMLKRCFSTIQKLSAREILDSRGNPTVEVDLFTSDGLFRAAVPSGASTGVYEALELRDGGSRYLGKGVQKAVSNINTIINKEIVGRCTKDQTGIDKFLVEVLDGTKNEWGWCKSKLGANSILAVSLAVARAGAKASGLKLYEHIAVLAGRERGQFIMPVPALNVINGGSHAGNKLAMQEFMIFPTGGSSFSDGLRIGAEVYHSLKTVIKKKYGQDAINVGDEGGFAPSISEAAEAISLLMEAIHKSGHDGKVKIGLDVAASEFYISGDKKYDLDFKNTGNPDKNPLSGHDLATMYSRLSKTYPIVSIEDPFDQDDWESYQYLTKLMNNTVQIVGDDLLVTNPVRVKMGIEKNACNALLLKVNQIGSLTESIEACQIAQKAGWGVMVSHRSGETEDNFIADLVVGLGTGQIKTGAPCRSERLSKYNQLLRIEEELGNKAVYAGENFRNPRNN